MSVYDPLLTSGGPHNQSTRVQYSSELVSKIRTSPSGDSSDSYPYHCLAKIAHTMAQIMSYSLTTIDRHLECGSRTKLVVELELHLIEKNLSFGFHCHFIMCKIGK